jgi:hypothetical protein
MKRIALFILTIICLFSLKINVFALCQDEELNDWAENAKLEFIEDTDAIYEIRDETGKVVETKTIERRFLYILRINPINDNVKVMVKDSISNEEKLAVTDEMYGPNVITSLIHFSDKIYTITIYGSSTSACPNEKLKTITYKVPKYNKYALTGFCTENPQLDVCKINTDNTNVDQEEFDKIVKDTNLKKELEKMSFFEKTLYYIGEYWYYVVIPIIIVVIVYFIMIRMYKKKVNKE